LIYSFIVIFFFSLSYAGKVETTKSKKKKNRTNYKIIHSDKLKIEKKANEIISHFIGKVHFFYDNMEFFCDVAKIYEIQEKIELKGNVKIIRDTVTAKANKVIYIKKKKILSLEGNVFIEKKNKKTEKKETFVCQKLEVNRKTGQVKADKEVQMYSQERNIEAFCGKLRYNTITKKGYMVENPVIFSLAKDTVKIVAEKMEILDEKMKIRALHNVETLSDYHRTTSKRLIYLSNDKTMILLGDPKFYSDRLEASSDRFYIYNDNKAVSLIVLEKNCEVNFNTEKGEKKENKMVSQKVDIDFKNSKVRKITATTNVALFLKNKDSIGVSVNEIYGDTLLIKINKDKDLEYITMKSKRIKGVYKFEK